MKHTQTITPHGGFNKLENMESNKLIAEFMGFQETSIGWYDADECLHEKDNTFDTLRFDTDWNWLMPVVEKIENYNDGYTLVIIEDERCHINTQNGYKVDVVMHTKIRAVYDSCCNFIEWYYKND